MAAGPGGGVAPVPARAPDVLAQPERGVLRRPAAARAAGDLRRGVRRPPGGPRRDRARDRRPEHHVGDVHVAGLQPHDAARARDPQAPARHAAADLRLPGRAGRQRGRQRGPAAGDRDPRRAPPARRLLAGRLGLARRVRRRRRHLLRAARRRARARDPEPRVRARVRQRRLPPADPDRGRLLRRQRGAVGHPRHRPGAAADAPRRRPVGRDDRRRGRRRARGRAARARRSGPRVAPCSRCAASPGKHAAR